MIAPTASDIGSALLMIATRPKVASAAERPSSSGMPAATSVPNATRRISSVSGTERRPAFFKSLKKSFSIAFSVLSPNDPTKNSGCVSCTSLTRATIGSTLSAASSLGPRISVPTSAECLSSEIWPMLSSSSGDSTLATASRPETPATTDWMTALNSGEPAVSFGCWMSTLSPPGCLKSL
jgi:hypothetical protein